MKTIKNRLLESACVEMSLTNVPRNMQPTPFFLIKQTIVENFFSQTSRLANLLHLRVFYSSSTNQLLIGPINVGQWLMRHASIISEFLPANLPEGPDVLKWWRCSGQVNSVLEKRWRRSGGPRHGQRIQRKTHARRSWSGQFYRWRTKSQCKRRCRGGHCVCPGRN